MTPDEARSGSGLAAVTGRNRADGSYIHGISPRAPAFAMKRDVLT